MSDFSQEDAPKYVWGVKAIAGVIQRTERQTRHLIRAGKIPAQKVGKTYLSTEAALHGKLADVLKSGTTTRAA